MVDSKVPKLLFHSPDFFIFFNELTDPVEEAVFFNQQFVAYK